MEALKAMLHKATVAHETYKSFTPNQHLAYWALTPKQWENLRKERVKQD